LAAGLLQRSELRIVIFAAGGLIAVVGLLELLDLVGSLFDIGVLKDANATVPGGTAAAGSAGAAAAAAGSAGGGGTRGQTPGDGRAAEADTTGRQRGRYTDRYSAGPIDPHALQDMTPEQRGEAEYNEEQRRIDVHELYNPDETTAPPPSDTRGQVVRTVVRGVSTMGGKSPR
jgi:hypothetical protein